MSFYDHKVLQDLRLGQWSDPPALRSWEKEREWVQKKPCPNRAERKKTRRWSLFRWLTGAAAAAN